MIPEDLGPGFYELAAQFGTDSQESSLAGRQDLQSRFAKQEEGRFTVETYR